MKSTKIINGIIYINKIDHVDHYRGKKQIRISFMNDGNTMDPKKPNVFISLRNNMEGTIMKDHLGYGRLKGDTIVCRDKFLAVASFNLEDISEDDLLSAKYGSAISLQIRINKDGNVDLYQRPNYENKSSDIKPTIIGHGKVVMDWPSEATIVHTDFNRLKTL